MKEERNEKLERKLVKEAIRAKEFSYSPYSHFRVGAALLTKSGKIYTGCNIENAAYSPTNCAERTAVFKAISEGEREFLAIAVSGDREDYLAPCGVCRQVLLEFCDPDQFSVLMVGKEEDYQKMTLGELLPAAFSKEDVQSK